MMAELAAFWPAGAGLPYLALSDEQAAGDHPVPDDASQPQVEMTSDLEVISDVITGQPQRHKQLTAARPERGPVIAADQGAEYLAAPGFLVPAAQHHAARCGAKSGRGVAVGFPSQGHQSLELVALHVARHLRSREAVVR